MKKAVKATFSKRETLLDLENIDQIIKAFAQDKNLKKLWKVFFRQKGCGNLEVGDKLSEDKSWKLEILKFRIPTYFFSKFLFNLKFFCTK